MLDKSAASVDLWKLWVGRAMHGGNVYREWTYDPLPEAIHLDPPYSCGLSFGYGLLRLVGPSLQAENGKSQPICKTGARVRLESQGLATF